MLIFGGIKRYVVVLRDGDGVFFYILRLTEIVYSEIMINNCRPSASWNYFKS